jgi:fructose 1,6-bisphosphate aldolase/phosphatase
VEAAVNTVTISAIKADVGGYVGHCDVHPELLSEAARRMREAIADELLLDGRVGSCGDDVNLVMTHRRGVDDEAVHRFAWETFVGLTGVAQRLHLYGAGQDLLAEAFSGNVRGAGPGVAEMEIAERPSEPFVVFAADKCAPGAWNLPLYKMFCDPFNTAGLVIDNHMHDGFVVEVHDLIEHQKAVFRCPEDLYDLLVYIGTTGRYVIKHVFRRDDLDEPVASTSTSRDSNRALRCSSSRCAAKPPTCTGNDCSRSPKRSAPTCAYGWRSASSCRRSGTRARSAAAPTWRPLSTKR